MDMSSRFIASPNILRLLKERTQDPTTLPSVREIIYLPAGHGDLTGQIRFGFIRLRELDGETVELSCNRRIYKRIGYEHEKFVLFVGAKDKAMYLVAALGQEMIGEIVHNTRSYHVNGTTDFRFLFTISNSKDKVLETLKIESETEDGILHALQLIGLDQTLIDEVDPAIYLLT
jgi:hypothetical protein